MSLHCLNEDVLVCEGEVELRESLSGTGTRIARCGHHFSVALESMQAVRERYPDQATPPAWFDPSYAGEHWDEDY